MRAGTCAPAKMASFEQLKTHSEEHWRQFWHGSKPTIIIGGGTCGRLAGAVETLAAFRNEIEQRGLDCSIYEAGCMGYCFAEPLVIIAKPGCPPMCYDRVGVSGARLLVDAYLVNKNPSQTYSFGEISLTIDDIPVFKDFPRANLEHRIILKNCGVVDPMEIEHSIALGGYQALAKAIEMPYDEIIDEVVSSGLKGRGGAGFSTGEKWKLCKDAPGETKYLICNSDEGDPGAFVDRTLLESDPHSVIEGMIIAGLAVGAQQGIIYVRAEYPLAIERIEAAVSQAYLLGFLGENILDSSFSFSIEVFAGAGAFVCGEETALIASLEGLPGIPRPKPPYPSEKSLNGKPTLINNVKTFAYIRHIILNGARWFTDIGSEDDAGTAVFALAGKVVNAGVVEVPMGTTLRQVIFDIGGGVQQEYVKEKDSWGLMLSVKKEKDFKAVQIGGPSGGCLPESALDLPIGFDSILQAGAMIGSGGMIVLDEDDCIVDVAKYFLEFTQKESCGKCTFCRLGTVQMLNMLTEFTEGKGSVEDLDVLLNLAEDVKTGSLCGLGKTAPNPVLSTMRYFRDEYEAHINEQRCSALSCNDLIEFKFLDVRCSSFCGTCLELCEAISTEYKRKGVHGIRYIAHSVDPLLCTKCAMCLDSCVAINHKSVLKVSPIGKAVN